MCKYIDRDKLIMEGWSLQRTYQKDAATMVYEVKKPEDIPPADVRPVVRGRWIVHYDDIWPTESTKECSECHEEVTLLIDCKFCPNCGAEMEVDEDG